MTKRRNRNNASTPRSTSVWDEQTVAHITLTSVSPYVVSQGVRLGWVQCNNHAADTYNITIAQSIGNGSTAPSLTKYYYGYGNGRRINLSRDFPSPSSAPFGDTSEGSIGYQITTTNPSDQSVMLMTFS